MHHLLAAFQSLITVKLVTNAEDLDIVIPMYNLIEYSKNYSKTSGNLWNYYRDESNNPKADNYNADLMAISELFKYKQVL